MERSIVSLCEKVDYALGLTYPHKTGL